MPEVQSCETCWVSSVVAPCVARLSCRACEFEKRENRLGSKRVLGRLRTELVVAQVGSMLLGSRPMKGIEKKGLFFY